MKLLPLILSVLAITTALDSGRAVASGNCGPYGTPIRSNGNCSLCQTTQDANYRMWPMYFGAQNGAEIIRADSRRFEVEYSYNQRVGSGVCKAKDSAPSSASCGRHGTVVRAHGSCALCQTTQDANYRMWPMFFVTRDSAEDYPAQSRRSDVEYVYNERVGSGVCESGRSYRQAAQISEAEIPSAE